MRASGWSRMIGIAGIFNAGLRVESRDHGTAYVVECSKLSYLLLTSHSEYRGSRDTAITYGICF